MLVPSALPNNRFSQDQLDNFAKRVKTFGASGKRTAEQAAAAKLKFQGIVDSLPEGSIQIWPDGSKLGKPAKGPTGAGAVIYCTPSPKPLFNLVYQLGISTNNTAEFWAIGGALTTILDNNLDKNREIHIFTDSQFVLNCLTGVYQSATHYKITSTILQLIKRCWSKPKFYHVPGHADIPGNEAADALAKEGAHHSEGSQETLPLMDILTNLGFNYLSIEHGEVTTNWDQNISDYLDIPDFEFSIHNSTCSGNSI